MKRTFLAIALACSAFAGVMAQTPPPASGAALKIGVIGPLSGPSSDFGLPMLNGVKLAVDEINSFGGYLGRPLELVIPSSASSSPRNWSRKRSSRPSASATPASR